MSIKNKEGNSVVIFENRFRYLRPLYVVVLLLASLGCWTQTNLQTNAEAKGQIFSVASLNVDGLPQKVLGISVNSDGPGSSGTSRISRYLTQKGYDVIGVQEDFEYDHELRSSLSEDYDYGEWQGGILDNIGWSAFTSLKVYTDGLRLFWRKEHKLTQEEAVTWDDSYGKFDHAWDDMAAKGFRRAEVTLGNGCSFVVYDMHMDASDDDDEKTGDDWHDKAARWSQWRQLCSAVMDKLDDRPVVLLGDMNSYYTRDSILALFFHPIESTGQYTVHDAWVEFVRQGNYPAIGDQQLSTSEYGFVLGETLDKILYINPVKGDRLSLVDYHVETDYTWDDGSPLGDHYPIAAVFRLESEEATIVSEVSSRQNVRYYDLNGREVSQPFRGMYIMRYSDGRTQKVFF